MKGRTKRANGGDVESPKSGSREWEQDLADKPEARTNAKKIDAEAEEKKRGGRAKKKTVKMEGKKEMRADRKPRKSGGRAGSDKNPLSSAHAGMEPKGHKSESID